MEFISNNLNNSSAYALIADKSDLFLGTDANGILSNYGTSWNKVNQGFLDEYNNPIGPVLSFVVLDNYIFAGTGKGLWRRPLSDMITGITELSS